MSVFPHLLACAPVFAFSGLLIFFNSKQSPRREQLSLSEVGILQPALEPGFLEKLDRGDRSGGCSWGPRDSRAAPTAMRVPSWKRGAFPRTPCSGLVAVFRILLQLFCAGPVPTRGLFRQHRPGLPARRGLCRALAPGPSSRSTPRAGMDTTDWSSSWRVFCLFFLAPCFSQKFSCEAVTFPGLDTFKTAAFEELNCFLSSLGLV